MIVNHTLKEAHLCSNKFGDDGITAIAKALENSKICLLNVRECGITFTGAKSLAEALALNCSIRELWVMNNPVTVEGACLIVCSAAHNTVCEKVLIDDDYENDDEVKKLLALIDNKLKQNVCCYILFNTI